jgi:hypothetical protein
MIIDLYVVWMIINFFIFFIALTDMIKLQRGTRIMLMVISAILFFVLALVSFNIEQTFCSYSSGWQCQTQSISDSSLGIINVLFGIISLLYIIMDVMGWLPNV